MKTKPLCSFPSALAALAAPATLAALTTLSLAGCSGGDDVYVRETNAAQSSTSPLSCEVSIGADMCSRTLDEVPDSERARVATALQALADFASVSALAVLGLSATCDGILGELDAPLPYIPTRSTHEEILALKCQKAADAIIAAGGRGMLEIIVAAPTCAPAVPRACSETAAPALGGRFACEPAKVTIFSTSATQDALAVGRALSLYFGKVASWKTELESMARLTSAITEGTTAYAHLPNGCIATATTLATQSTHYVSAVAASVNVVANAADWVGH